MIKAAGTKQENFLYVADCKLATQTNLQILDDNPFVTRLSATYKAHREVIDLALAEDDWEQVGTLNQTPQSTWRPAAAYKIQDRRVELYGKTYRAIVAHSDSNDKRRVKRIKRDLKADKDQALKVCADAGKQTYRCRTDAQAALDNLRRGRRARLWEIEGQVEEGKVFARGRPPADGQRAPKDVYYQLTLSVTENAGLIAGHKERAGLLCPADQH